MSKQTAAYRQIYYRYVNLITEGTLEPGTRVQSIRAMASELGLSKGTVEVAYDLLIGEGYFESRGRAGTFVSTNLHQIKDYFASTTKKRSGSNLQPKSPSPREPHTNLWPFQMGVPAFDKFPQKIWLQVSRHAMNRLNDETMRAPPITGIDYLRNEIAKYLQLSRGISCNKDQIIITNGFRNSLDLVRRTLLRSNDSVWVEDPSFPAAAKLFASCGHNIVSVGVDRDGMIVSEGLKKFRKSKLAITTPSHQSPFCVPLSLQRRLEILEWAAQNQSWIFEDDYDAEFSYSARPLPSLKSIDVHDRVLYGGTFSKTILPSLRVAYLVVPKDKVVDFYDEATISQSGPSHVVQLAIAEFMAQGYFFRHLRKMRLLYKQRRAFLVQALYEKFEQSVFIETGRGGMHLVVEFKDKVDVNKLKRIATEQQLYVGIANEWSSSKKKFNCAMLGYTNIQSLTSARRAADRFFQLYNACLE